MGKSRSSLYQILSVCLQHIRLGAAQRLEKSSLLSVPFIGNPLVLAVYLTMRAEKLNTTRVDIQEFRDQSIEITHVMLLQSTSDTGSEISGTGMNTLVARHLKRT
jgi:hypothetical protein